MVIKYNEEILAAAIIQRACKDYVTAKRDHNKKLERDAKAFLLDKNINGGVALFGYICKLDGADIIKRLDNGRHKLDNNTLDIVTTFIK